MTYLPLAERAVEALRGPEWPDYKVGPLCALEGCSRLTDHAHHLWRRSFTAGPCSWVRLPDGTVVGNLMPLCWHHHQQVTDNRARIVWSEEYGGFWWDGEDDGFDNPRRLAQPPTIERVRDGVPQNGHEPPDSCPTCGQRVRPKFERNTSEQKRPRKTWTITVPHDSREFGADILDGLLESCRLILDDKGISYGEDRGVRYFILSTSLGIFVAHADDILSDG